MSDQDHMPDPIDQVYARAEASLTDEAARAARRARVLAAVAQEAPLPIPANLSGGRPRRAGLRWGGFATAASVAGLAGILAFHTYRVPALTGTNPAALTPVPPGSSQAPAAAPSLGASSRPQAVKPSARAAADPDPDMAAPPPMVSAGAVSPAPPPPAGVAGADITASATNTPGFNAVGSPIQRISREDLLKSGATDIRSALQTLPLIQTAGGVSDSAGISGVVRGGESYTQGFGEGAGVQTADIGGQGSRATLTLLDGQRLAPTGPNASMTEVSQAPASALGGAGANTVGRAAASPDFNIPSGNAATALAAWSAVSGVKIDAPAALLSGARTAAVSGRMDPRDALDKMIAGARLQVIADDGSQISLGSSAGDTVATVNLAAIGTNIAGVKAVGSPVQRVSREDLLKSGATDTQSALRTLPLVQTPDAASDPAARLRAAAAAGRTAEVQTLLAQPGLALDAPDADGNTALMLSIKSAHPDIVVLLRKRGASLELTNKAGQKPADLARLANNAAITQALALPVPPR